MTRAIADIAIPILPYLFAGGFCAAMGLIVWGNLTQKGRW